MPGAGARVVLLRTVPVSARPYADAASKAAHNTPTGTTAAAESAPKLRAAEPSLDEPTGNRWAALVKE